MYIFLHLSVVCHNTVLVPLEKHLIFRIENLEELYHLMEGIQYSVSYDIFRILLQFYSNLMFEQRVPRGRTALLSQNL